MLGFDFLPAGGREACCGLLDAPLADWLSEVGSLGDDRPVSLSVESGAATPKKLATASHELFKRDFSCFGFSALSISSPELTFASTDFTGSTFGAAGGVLGAPDKSVLRFCGAKEGVPSKFAKEFQWSDI
jgi:hypothetical protein